MALSEQIACRPASAVRARMVLADLVALTKPRIVDLLVMTGAAAAVAAAGGWPGTRPLAEVILGGALAAGGAGSMNMALEADIERRMVDAYPYLGHGRTQLQ
jgi:protoheme IX farnesyltransferase